MNGRFAGAWMKINRAKHHIRDLDAHITEFLSRQPYRLVVEPDLESTNYCLVFRERETMPDIFALIFGDAVHNLRCALDILIYTCVTLNGNTPTAHTAFPFFGKSDTLDDAIKRRQIYDAGENVVQVIRGLEHQMRQGQPLAAIHELDIHDKHHMILTVGSRVVKDVSLSQDGVTYVTVSLNARNVFDGARAIGFPPVENAKFGDELRVSFQVTMPKGFAEFEPLIPTLVQLVEFVEGVVKDFGALPAFPNE